MSRIVKTDDKRFVKDLYTNAVINIDKEGYQSFMSNRQRVLRQQQLEKQVQNLQQDIGDIKQLLQQLLNGKTDGKSNS